MLSKNALSIAGSVSDSLSIVGNSNTVTVYIGLGVTQSAAQDTHDIAAIQEDRSPYQGLAAFFEEDANRFFGRDGQIDRLWTNLQQLIEGASDAVRILPILGPSGCGKSSLVRAGLVPEIARHKVLSLSAPTVVVITPTGRPIESLSHVLARLITGDPAPVAKSAEFEEALRKRGGGEYDGLRRISQYIPNIHRNKLILLIDQFEELYTLCSDPNEQDCFIENLLLAASDSTYFVTVIIVLRIDFLGSTQRHASFNNLLTGKGIIVPVMSDRDLAQAISNPAAQAGRPFDPVLVQLLVQDTIGRDGALPLLQFALQQLWIAACNKEDLLKKYQDIGGVGGALVREADQIYDSMTEASQKIARRAFRGMVQLGEGVPDTRRRIHVDTLVSEKDTRDDILRVLRVFSKPSARLVTFVAKDVDIAVEITHETLIRRWGKIQEWLGPVRT